MWICNNSTYFSYKKLVLRICTFIPTVCVCMYGVYGYVCFSVVILANNTYRYFFVDGTIFPHLATPTTTVTFTDFRHLWCLFL